MKKGLFISGVLVSFLMIISCNNTSDKVVNDNIGENSEEKIDSISNEHHEKTTHWSHHKGEDGPAHWNHLCEEYSACGGKSQSPINIVTSNIIKSDSLNAPVFNYGESMVDIINNKHTVQFNISGDNSVMLNGKKYELKQFHYHTSSEHTINGEYYPIEIHFVHVHSETDYAVIGILFEEGEENPLFANYLEKFPPSEGEYKDIESNLINLLNLFPEDKSYYNYKGSLTTPPCTEIVNWYLFKTPLTASKEQIAQLSEILDNNYRPVLPLNGREVKVYED